jgi:hypothetical protein
MLPLVSRLRLSKVRTWHNRVIPVQRSERLHPMRSIGLDDGIREDSG